MKHSMNSTMEAGLTVLFWLACAVLPATGIYGLVILAFGNDFSEVWFTTAMAAFVTGFALFLGVIVGSVYGMGYLHLRYRHRVTTAIGKVLIRLGKEE